MKREAEVKEEKEDEHDANEECTDGPLVWALQSVHTPMVML